MDYQQDSKMTQKKTLSVQWGSRGWTLDVIFQKDKIKGLQASIINIIERVGKRKIREGWIWDGSA